MNKSRKIDPVSFYLCCILGLVTTAAILTQAIWSGWRLPLSQPVVVQARPLASPTTTSDLIRQLDPTAFREDRMGQLALDVNARVSLPQGEPIATANARITENRFSLGASETPLAATVTALTKEILETSSAGRALADYSWIESSTTDHRKTISSRGRQETLMVRVRDQLTGAVLRNVEFRSE